MRKKILLVLCVFCLALSGCGKKVAEPEQVDVAEEASTGHQFTQAATGEDSSVEENTSDVAASDTTDAVITNVSESNLPFVIDGDQLEFLNSKFQIFGLFKPVSDAEDEIYFQTDYLYWASYGNEWECDGMSVTEISDQEWAAYASDLQADVAEHTDLTDDEGYNASMTAEQLTEWKESSQMKKIVPNGTPKAIYIQSYNGDEYHLLFAVENDKIMMDVQKNKTPSDLVTRKIVVADDVEFVGDMTVDENLHGLILSRDSEIPIEDNPMIAYEVDKTDIVGAMDVSDEETFDPMGGYRIVKTLYYPKAEGKTMITAYTYNPKTDANNVVVSTWDMTAMYEVEVTATEMIITKCEEHDTGHEGHNHQEGDAGHEGHAGHNHNH